MDRLETLVRDAFAEHADNAPPAGDLLAAVTARGPRRRWYPALAAAAVVLLAVALLVALRSDGARHDRAAVVPAPPVGYRWQSYRGITVAVPARLATVESTCVPLRNVVLSFDGVYRFCPNVKKPRSPGTVVALGLGGFDEALSVIPAHLRIDGHDAERGYGPGIRGLLGGARVGVVAIADLGVIVTVSTPSRQVMNTVLDSIRITPVDRFGCLAKPDAVAPVTAPSEHLAPGNPVTVVRCSYSSYGALKTFGLNDSARLAPGKVVALARLVDDLPRHAGAGHFGPTIQWLVLGYADGSTRILTYGTDSRYLTSGGAVGVVSDGRAYAVDRTGQLRDVLS